MSSKAFPNDQAPELILPTLSGEEFNLAETVGKADFTILFFYRGKHCPLCVMQFQDLEKNFEKVKDAKMQMVGISMDTEEKAQGFVSLVDESGKLQTPIAYGMTEKQAQQWGLYMSKGRTGTNEPAVFSEPGMYVIKPDNTVFMAQVQSAPFTRPSIEQLVGGLSYAHANDYPARGTIKATAMPQ